MVLEPAGGLPGAQIPQTETLVPGAGESEVPVRREDHVRNKVARQEIVSDL